MITRIGLVNSAVDVVSQSVRDATGTQGSLAARLGQTLESDGSLKKSAVDNTEHNIGYHEDGAGPDSVEYVRMKADERTKLSGVAEEATDVTLEVETEDGVVTFESGSVRLIPSDGISWTVESTNRVKAQTTFPLDAAHRHYYDIVPQHVPDNFTDFTTGATAFIEGSLRVYINGVRLSDSDEVYTPSSTVSGPWKLNRFTPTVDGLGFSLLNAITSNDIIRIDFDILLD